jgi:outer membrane protein
VVALAIENNIDVEIQRYGPLLAQQILKRAQAGGALRSVGLGVATGPQSVSLQGVSVNTSGGVGLSAGNGVSSGGGIVTQLGPAIPSLDPTLLGIVSFGHTTYPQSNLVLTNTPVLVDTTRFFEAQYVQNFEFGLAAQLTYLSTRSNVNSASYSLNPSTSGDLDLVLTQNLLQDSDGR